MIKFFNGVYRAGARPSRFLSTLIVSGIAYGLYRGVQDNYLVEVIKITPFERGIVEFFREIPGLLVMLLLAAMYRFSESKIFKIGVAIMLAGMTCILFSPSIKALVVICMVIFSFGEHIVMPVRSTISMDLAEESRRGASLGITSTINNLGNISGYLIVTLLFFIFARLGFSRTDTVQFRTVFAISAALMVAAVLISLAIKETELKSSRRRFYIAKKFNKYYMLEIFYGARKQIFFTFGPLVLIAHYNADTSIISFLLAICAGAGMLFSPLAGKPVWDAFTRPIL
jgi:MFS family permease